MFTNNVATFKAEEPTFASPTLPQVNTLLGMIQQNVVSSRSPTAPLNIPESHSSPIGVQTTLGFGINKSLTTINNNSFTINFGSQPSGSPLINFLAAAAASSASECNSPAPKKQALGENSPSPFSPSSSSSSSNCFSFTSFESCAKALPSWLFSPFRQTATATPATIATESSTPTPTSV
eukprot:TRINITY_DN1000_c0_g1_i2.p1 TRINITY_DN1000_c0_g1~~TRINITY_DN1000_c0_g1_i2.p1  ORF type:complete len:179 (-),score=71.05 TRINITY_DN1000_c0_g1_i2:129-665(-)